MKKKYIIGNWKSNKTTDEARQWLESFKSQISNLNDQLKETEIILCPSYIHLPIFSAFIQEHKLPLHLGAQDVSAFESGAYTGAVNALQLAGLVEYVLIGHSERRTHFNESDDILAYKVAHAFKNNLKVIYCVPNEKTTVPNGIFCVAYEPVWAIGSGRAESPENANRILDEIKKNTTCEIGIYGGSVTDENVASFLNKPSIDGVLPGGASLKPESFISLITHANNLT